MTDWGLFIHFVHEVSDRSIDFLLIVFDVALSADGMVRWMLCSKEIIVSVEVTPGIS